MSGTEELLCDGCGAPLDVGTKARFVTCGFCGARLRVKHSETAGWTEKVEEIAKRQDRMDKKQRELERQLKINQLKDELSDLERAFDTECEQYMARMRGGDLIPPDTMRRRVLWLGGISVPLFTLWFYYSFQEFAVVTLVVMALPLVIVERMWAGKITKYRQAQQRYEAEKLRISDEIGALRAPKKRRKRKR